MTAANTNQYPFQNPDLPLDERVNDLVSRFTVEEKIQLMCQHQVAVPRLGVKGHKQGTEGAHGVAWLGEATVFPQNTGLACTWNAELLHQIGSVIGDEARVYFDRDPVVNGLTIWAPTVDMERDPRWGRTEEAYGEDPHLTGTLATELVKGLQGDDPFYYKAVASLKHFYGNNNEIDRGSASVSIDPRNKREYYLKVFEQVFREGRAGSMMTAYNGINGIPCNFNTEVNEIVKGEWGMDGFVVGDAGDVMGTVLEHGYVDSYAQAVAGSIKAGLDSLTDDEPIMFQALHDALEQGLLDEADLDRALRNAFRVRFRLGDFDPVERNPYGQTPTEKLCAPEHAKLALTAARESIVLLKNDGILPLAKEGSSSVALIGPLAGEVFTDWYSGTPVYRVTPLQGLQEKVSSGQVHFGTGLERIRLRCAATGKYIAVASGEGGEAVLTANVEDASQAAVFERNDWGWGQFTLYDLASKKFVTLTDDSVLTSTSVDVSGWFVKEVFGFDAEESGKVAMKSWDGKPIILDGQARLTVAQDEQRLEDEAGRLFVEIVENGLDQAVAAAKAAETAVVFVGNSPFINAKETIDRQDIVLPPAQQALIQAVYAANPRTVVVIVGSYPFAVNWEEEHVPAMLFMSHGGQEHGRALADVLFGDYNPAGRLNMTWYQSVDQLPDLMDYDIIKGKRTYQYFDGSVLYPFGHGLSYTTFEYSGLSLDQAEVTADGQIAVSVQIRNTGHRAGDEVVQWYARAEQSRVIRPLKTLKGFTRVHLLPGETKLVSFTLKAEDLAFWDVTRDRYCVETGNYTVMVGPSSGLIAESATFQVQGETVPPRSLCEQVRAANYDDYSGVFLDECREGGDSVRLAQESGWIAFHDVEFGEGASRFTARVTGNKGGGKIVLTLDKPEGEQVLDCKVLPTGGRQGWTTVAGQAESGWSGRRSLYLHLQGEVQISWFQVE